MLHLAEPTTTHVLTTTENNTKLCKAVDNVAFHKKIKERKGSPQFCEMRTLPFVFGATPFYHCF